MKKILLLALVTIGTLTNYAQTTIENFSFGTTTDTLTNPANGGVNWKSHSGTKGSFTSSLIYNTSSLTYTGYSSSGVGGSVEVWGTSRSEDANRVVPAYNNGSVYASFLVRVDSVLSTSTVGDYIVHFCDTFGTGILSNFRPRLFVKMGSVSSTFKLGLSKGGAGAVANFSSDYAFGATLLVVLKYKFDLTATSNDSTFAFIFASGIPSSEPTTPTLVSTDVASDFIQVRSICIRQGSAANFRALVDGFRVSNSWGTSALPVKFTSFNAIINNKQTNLSWTTASEINNKGFEVERSTDGVNFETIGFVKGNGNSNRISKYSFVHPNQSSAFYRLKQIDFDGKFDYSNVISVQGNDLIIDITPNPFNNVIEINSNGNLVTAEVLDITGKVVITETINGNKTTLNTSSLNNGVYFVRISNGENVITKRLIKN
ncbi:MAG: T9SS type A sorting domain-containing protein [Bacteroidia bacterium]